MSLRARHPVYGVIGIARPTLERLEGHAAQ